MLQSMIDRMGFETKADIRSILFILKKINDVSKELDGYKKDAYEAEMALAKAQPRLIHLNKLESSLKILSKDLKQWKGATEAWGRHLNRIETPHKKEKIK